MSACWINTQIATTTLMKWYVKSICVGNGQIRIIHVRMVRLDNLHQVEVRISLANVGSDLGTHLICLSGPVLQLVIILRHVLMQYYLCSSGIVVQRVVLR